MRKKRVRRAKKASPWIGIAVLAIISVIVTGSIYFSLPFSRPDVETPTTITRARVGDVAPDFRLPTADGSFVSLSEYRGYPVLLFFNEGVGCDPCWRQIVELQESPELSGLQVRLVAITVDPVDQLKPIMLGWGIKVPVASDASRKIVAAYDALNVGSMHPGQKPGHTFILGGVDGIIKWRFDLPQSQADSGIMYVPTEEVINAIQKALAGG